MNYRQMLLLQDLVNNLFEPHGYARVIFKFNTMVVSGHFIEESKQFETQYFWDSFNLIEDYWKSLDKDHSSLFKKIQSVKMNSDFDELQDVDLLNKTIFWDVHLHHMCMHLTNVVDSNNYFSGRDLPEKIYNLHFNGEIYEEYSLQGDDIFTPLSLHFVE